MSKSVEVRNETFEEIEEKQNEMRENLDKVRDVFGTKKYLEKELTWNRGDNSYYDSEGHRFCSER
ncbi:hypothetical protein [Clostridium sulfidigenes]|uniref:hypothetical protein n=1 Tax=Clostridium sulfidigenes TaxID=318464 RepID=UPI003F88E2FC